MMLLVLKVHYLVHVQRDLEDYVPYGRHVGCGVAGGHGHPAEMETLSPLQNVKLAQHRIDGAAHEVMSLLLLLLVVVVLVVLVVVVLVWWWWWWCLWWGWCI